LWNTRVAFCLLLGAILRFRSRKEKGQGRGAAQTYLRLTPPTFCFFISGFLTAEGKGKKGEPRRKKGAKREKLVCSDDYVNSFPFLLLMARLRTAEKKKIQGGEREKKKRVKARVLLDSISRLSISSVCRFSAPACRKEGERKGGKGNKRRKKE